MCSKYRLNVHNHKCLQGRYSGYMECHIEPDWLLIWKADREAVYLTRTGTHSDLLDNIAP
ncbi:MAG: type II toxin-antitoxin system YafQ family toxin [Desulfobacteraceae bacterium]|nr:type II toxin-antitoxin system YafQ family toxin [Desulfobacteraceae bacterium]